MSCTFDQFWNSGLAVPIEAFGSEVDEVALKNWRNGLSDDLAGTGTIYNRALTSP